jgi:hypothetical protein
VLTRTGGFLGVDRRVELDGATLRVSARGGAPVETRLDDATTARLARLATDARPILQSGEEAPEAMLASDDLTTHIEVADDDGSVGGDLHSGGEVPPEVEALMVALDDLARAAG